MLARTFLMATAPGGTTPSIPPAGPPTVFELVASTENVGWVEIPYPAAMTSAGKTFFGYVKGSNGDVKAAMYDSATDTTSTAVVLHAALGGEGTADNHDSPAFVVRQSDSKVLTAYCRHAGSAILMRLSSSALDATAFASETSLDRGNQHDYPTFFYVGTTLWLLFRDTTSGQNANLCYVTSSDHGATWSTVTAVYNGTAGHTPYWRLWLDVASGRIHVVVTDLEPNTVSKLGHFYIDTSDGSLHKSDTTTIVASPPLAYASISAIDDGTAGSTQTWGVTTDGSGYPVAIYMRHLTSDNAIRRASWNGSAWTTETILASTNGQLGINKFGSGCAIDPLDPDRVWIPVKATKFEMWEYRKSGGSWSGTQLTTGSSRDQVWPHAVFDSDGTVDVIWQDVTYTDDTHFGPGAIKAYGTG